MEDVAPNLVPPTGNHRLSTYPRQLIFARALQGLGAGGVQPLAFILIGEMFKAKNELWIGSKVGLFCTAEPGIKKGSYADFDWFRIEK